MRVLLSWTRASVVVLCTVAAMSAPVVVADAPSAGAALPPVSGCGFRLGAIANQGAAGTVFYSVALQPNSPAQHCIAVVTFTAIATIAPQFASQGPYRNIAHNPLTATEVVGFTPGRIPPALGVAWSSFHCADPALPGTLRFLVGNHAASVGIEPSTCDGNPSPSSFAPFTPPVVSAVGIAPTLDDHGYRTVDQVGNITAKGDATPFVLGSAVNAPFVAIQTAATGNGAWSADAAGHVTTFGGAEFHGDLRDVHLNAPIVGMAATSDGHGYWLVGSDGGVFAFGNAAFHGSLGNLHLNAPIVGMAATSDGHGYWLDAFDGGVFAFGDAGFMGSLGSIVLNAPVVGIAAGPHGGYWLVASDGGVFAFGAPFEGSASGIRLNGPISGIAATSSGKGYWLVGADNGIFNYGDAGFFGSSPSVNG
jgi:hypothetical protein